MIGPSFGHLYLCKYRQVVQDFSLALLYLLVLLAWRSAYHLFLLERQHIHPYIEPAKPQFYHLLGK